MANPRDSDDGLPYPVNPLTGRPIRDAQMKQLNKLRDVSFMVRAVLHELDGSTFHAEINPNFEVDDRYGVRDLSIAATKLDELMLWAAKAVLSTK